jgi:DNA/RNA endonuclease G (NUC1)
MRAALVLLACAVGAALSAAADRDDDELSKFAPDSNYLTYPGFLLGRPDHTGCNRWTLQRLDKNSRKGPGDRNKSSWHVDAHALPERHGRGIDYEGQDGKIAKGHTSPAQAHKRSQREMDACHTYANAVPQYQKVNAQSYEHVEERGFDLVPEEGGFVLVITIPIWKPQQKVTTGVEHTEKSRLIIDAIGPDQLWMPHYLARSYVVFNEAGKPIHTESYLVPNSDSAAKEEISTFLISIDDLEFASGLELWNVAGKDLLPAELEAARGG